MRQIRLVAITILVVAAGTLLAQTDTSAGNNHVVDKTFQSGGNIQLHLEAGDYTITPASGDHIVVSWSGRRAADATARVDIQGAQATIETHTPNNNGPRFTIQVPLHSNLQTRLSAGDLSVGPVEGNMDLELHAGDLRVNVADPELFSTVDASTSIGDLSPGPFRGKERGWIGHSLKWQGGGRYRLHAHVGTGDLTINSTPGSI